MSSNSDNLQASIGQGIEYQHDVYSGTANGMPFSDTTDTQDDNGALELLTDLPLEEQNGQWIPATITETMSSPLYSDVNGTYTSSITASGLVTVTENDSWDFTVGNPAGTYVGSESIQATIDLSTVNSSGVATFVWQREIPETYTDKNNDDVTYEVTDRNASLPVTLSPVTNPSIYISPDRPTVAVGGNATFTVSLDHPLAYSVTVHYATKDGTAFAGKDYTAESGDLTFAAGQLHQIVSVPILNDPHASGNFYVDLSNPAASGGATPTLGASEATEAVQGLSTLDYLEFSQLAYDITGTGSATVPMPSASDGSAFTIAAKEVNAAGLNSVAFVDSTTKQVVLSYRGSVSYYDFRTADTQLASGQRPDVFSQAEKFATDLENNSGYAGYTFYVTGHSLGAAEAEDVGADLQLGGVCFAGPGVSSLLQSSSSYDPDLTDCVITSDPVGMYATDTLSLPVPNGSHVSGVEPLASVEYFSNLFLHGLLSRLGALGSGLATGISALTQHPLFSYGQALLDAGLIPENPISHPSYVFGDITELYNNIRASLPGAAIAGFAPSTDASGDIVETGTVSAPTSTGTVVVDVSETLTSAGTTTLAVTEMSSANILSQMATIDALGNVTSDVITLNGNILDASTSAPGDVDFTSDGSLLVGESAKSPSLEKTLVIAANGAITTIEPSPNNFNGDGDSDILWQNIDGQAAVWLMNSTTPFSEPTVDSNPGSSWQVIGAGDFNGDGDADILWQNTNGQPAIWLMNGTTPFNETVVGNNPGPSWQVIGAGDFNGDGDADILWQNTNGQAAIWLMNGTTPFSEVTVGANPGPSWRIVGTGDFNGDGDADILWQNTSGQAAIWLMNGTTPLSETVIGNPGPSWRIVGTGDFNGDGDADILWQNANGQAAIWLMNGATPFSEQLVGTNPGPSWHIVGAGDYNGDGKSDILWQNDNGQASIWLMNGTTPAAEVLVGNNPGPTWHIHAAS